MKADFATVFMPKQKTESNSSLVDNNANSTSPTITILRAESTTMAKCFLITSLVLIVGVSVLSTAFIVRYEDKLEAQEARIEHLESKLDDFMMSLMPEIEMGDDPPDDDDEFVEYETKLEAHLGADEDEQEQEPFYSDSEEIEMELEQGQTTTTPTTPPPMKEFKDPAEMEMTLVRVGREGDESDEEEKFGKVVEISKSRSKRQIPFPNVPTFGPDVARTAEGVPIVEQSYLSSVGVTLRPRLLTKPTTDDAQRFTLYGSLDRTGSNLDWGHTHQGSGVLPHHQVSAAWDGDEGQGQRLSQAKEQHHGRRRVQVKSGDGGETELAGTGYSRGSNSNYRRQQQQRVTPSSSISSGSFSSGTYHRNSRVPATPEYFYPTTKSSSDSQSQHQFGPLRKLGNGEGEVIARVVQPNDAENEADSDTYANAAYGQSGSETSSTRRKVYGRRGQGHSQPQGQGQGGIVSSAQTQSYRRRGQVDDEDSGEVSIVKSEAWVEGPRPLAAHFVADVSNYTTAHKHYDGNGRLRNADGIFESWRPADWMLAKEGQSAEKNFVLNGSGVLTVKKAGLYYIYAQIHYLDEHDINGFVVQLNAAPFLQCTTMTETYSAGAKSNSCFTAGVAPLKKDDRLLLKDIETNRYSIFKPEKSFFGLFQITGSS